MPHSITSGPDGNLWFTEYYGRKIAKITTAGVITEYGDYFLYGPTSITSGPDGKLWAMDSYRAVKITTAGGMTKYDSNHNCSGDIMSGTGYNLWAIGYYICYITTAGGITEYSLSYSANTGYLGSGSLITLGTDNNLWFTTTASIGNITPPPPPPTVQVPTTTQWGTLILIFAMGVMIAVYARSVKRGSG
ncbi:lyase-like protein [Candidatus Magnetobacterium bavaricum]|uniref:Lyase-like protein n=1 Tax=Candidatus Magnetobacterium bavaricum TaxID=29290 RepID=A0A0F3GJ59_9BACT|nr:lyase-like protein [Candidatus Magnetobacterium bavaricum]